MNSISAEELRQWIASGKDFQLVDVRESFEREMFNIGGQHIPMGELLEQKDALAHDKPVVLYCEKGIRSGIAIQRLEISGFTNLINLSGGMDAWKKSPSNH